MYFYVGIHMVNNVELLPLKNRVTLFCKLTHLQKSRNTKAISPPSFSIDTYDNRIISM